MRLSSLPTSVQTLHEWMQENARKWQKRQFCNDGFTSIHSMPDWNLSIRAPEGPETILKGQELTSSFAASISWLKSHEHIFEQTDGHDGHVCLIWPWLQVQPYSTLLKLARPACRRTRKHVDYGVFRWQAWCPQLIFFENWMLPFPIESARVSKRFQSSNFLPSSWGPEPCVVPRLER